MGVQHTTNNKLVLAGIDLAADVVASTMGPGGHNVTVDLGQGFASFKDGVSVARLMNPDDPWQKIGAGIVTAACRRSVEEAGDGTTATAVLTKAMCHDAPKFNFTDVEAEILRASTPVVHNNSLDIEAVRAVATIAANNRADIGDAIADLYTKIGQHGLISVRAGEKFEVIHEPGYSYEGRVFSREFLNKPTGLEVDNAVIAVINQEVEKLHDLKTVLERHTAFPNRALVIIAAECSGQALASLAHNATKYRGGDKSAKEIYVISAPGFGESRHEGCADIAAITGTTVFNHMRGTDLKKFTTFGTADKITVKAGKVFIHATPPPQYFEYVTQQQDLARIAKLSSGLGIITVGGNTDIERSADIELVDDACRAAAAAIKSGYVPGAGMTLYAIAKKHNWPQLQTPAITIHKNWNRPIPDPKRNHELFPIADSTQAVLSAVKNSLSAATQFLTTKYFLIYK